MSLTKSLALLAGVLALFALPAEADQTFKVSRDLNLVSTSLNMIINPLTGDLYVLITQLDVDNRSFARVYGALVRYQPQTQNFAPGLPRLLSADAGWQGRATGIFALSIRRYVVVWDERGVEGPEISSRILGRQISASGKPKGSIAEVLDNGDSNDYPQIVDLLDDDCWDEEPPPINYRFFLAWNGNRPAGGDDRPTHGLNIAPITIGKKRISVLDSLRARIESNKDGAGIGPFPESISSYGGFRAGGAGSFGINLSGTRYIDDGGLYRLQGFSYRLDVDATSGLASLDTRLDMPIGLTVPSTIGVAAQSPRWDELFAVACNPTANRLNMLIWQDDSWSNQQEVSLKGFSTFAGQVIRAPRFYRPESAPVSPSAKPVYGHLIAAATDGWVYAQKITADGQFLRKPQKLFSHGNALQAMRVYRIDREGSPFNTAILWQKQVSANLHEAWIYFTNLK